MLIKYILCAPKGFSPDYNWNYWRAFLKHHVYAPLKTNWIRILRVNPDISIFPKLPSVILTYSQSSKHISHQCPKGGREKSKKKNPLMFLKKIVPFWNSIRSQGWEVGKQTFNFPSHFYLTNICWLPWAGRSWKKYKACPFPQGT